jgi:hypothetical protein
MDQDWAPAEIKGNTFLMSQRKWAFSGRELVTCGTWCSPQVLGLFKNLL